MSQSWLQGFTSHILLTARKPYHTINFSVFEGSAQTMMSVVYVVTCQRCYKLYIGETGRRLADRFGKHLRAVEGFKQNPRYQGGELPLPKTLI